jgi:hypothetical protein
MSMGHLNEFLLAQRRMKRKSHPTNCYVVTAFINDVHSKCFISFSLLFYNPLAGSRPKAAIRLTDGVVSGNFGPC